MQSILLLLKFTELVQNLAIEVLPDSRSVCFACAECATSPKVQQSSLEHAQEKKSLTSSGVQITICPW